MGLRADHTSVVTLTGTSISDTTTFIADAHALMEVVFDADDESLLGSDLLATIEKYLAAHFVSLRDPVIRSETTGKTRADFALGDNSGKNLKSTPFGQQACAMDLTGKLATVGETQGASLKAIDLDL